MSDPSSDRAGRTRTSSGDAPRETSSIRHHATTEPSTSTYKVTDKDKEHTSKATADATPPRPHLRDELSQLATQYANMLFALDDIPPLYNLLAGFFHWILLAGFVLFPGTVTSLRVSGSNQQVLNMVMNLPLAIVAWMCYEIGAVGLVWLWWRWRKNYLWSLNKIFLPGLKNSFAGLLSIITNVFGRHQGNLFNLWADVSMLRNLTVVVVSATTAFFAFLTMIYMFWLIRRAKAQHVREVGKQRAGKHGEGFLDISERRV